MRVDENVASLLAHAARQYGVFDRLLAHEYGIGKRELVALVRMGLLRRRDTCVFQAVGAPDSWHASLMSAVLAGGRHCVASHRAAAALYGLDGVHPTLVEVTVPQRVRYRRLNQPIRIHHSSDLDAFDCTSFGPIPVTTPVRTLIDLCAVVSLPRAIAALDGAERDGLVQRSLLAERNEELRRSGRNGTGVMHEILSARERIGNVPWNVLERAFHNAMASAGINGFIAQYPFIRPDSAKAFFDFARPDLRLACETDGTVAHATPAQRQRDYIRDRQSSLARWRVLRFTYEEVLTQPTAVAATVAAHIADLERRVA